MASTGLGRHGCVAKDVIVTALSCLIFLSWRIWLCHLCKSPSGSHRMLWKQPWAFPSQPKQAQVSVSPALAPGPSWPWAGLSLLSWGTEPWAQSSLVKLHQHQVQVGNNNWSWPETLVPQIPLLEDLSTFALFANYLQLNIHHCAKSSPAGLLPVSSQWLVLPCTVQFHSLNPMTFPRCPKVCFLQALSAGGQVSYPNLE